MPHDSPCELGSISKYATPEFSPVPPAVRSPRVGQVLKILSELQRTDLHPSVVVNQLFQQLVSCTRSADLPDQLTPAELAALQELCSAGEYQLESHWAQRIAANPDVLPEFPYLANYQELAAGECAALNSAPVRELVFIGAGPLPLSAIQIAKLLPAARITCLDSSLQAITQATHVLQALHIPADRITVQHCAAQDGNYSSADVVFLAALVGSNTAAKIALLDQIGLTLPARGKIAVRSVPGDGRRLLYPRFDLAALNLTAPHWRLVGQWNPPPTVINNLLIFQRP